MKQTCAKYASKFIKDGMIVGLGAGSTIQYVVDFVKDKKIQVVTPSMNTALLCQKVGLPVLNTKFVNHIDIAFDGCDEVDENLNALKSGGGIHTQEKIIASMANEYIVLIDEKKYFKTLSFAHPIVVEVLCNAYQIVLKRLEQMNAKVIVRKANNKDGFLLSEEGNYLFDVFFENVQDIETLNQKILMMPGVVDTSLFVDIVTGIIMVNDQGVLKKDKGGDFYAL